VSTAFSNLDREEIKEEVYYNPELNPVKLIEYLDGLDDDVIKNMTQKYSRIELHLFINQLFLLSD
jgi:hypothetical protein